MRTPLLALTLASALALAVPAVSSAATPPDNGAVNQYTETFPGPGGNEPTQEDQTPDSERSAPHRSSEEVLGPENARRLEGLGADGKAAAAVAATTAPTESSATAAPSADNSGSQQGGGSGLGEIVGQATGTSGTGGASWLLPLFLAAVVVASLAFLWRKHRTE